jgi:hypothetical protein
VALATLSIDIRAQLAKLEQDMGAGVRIAQKSAAQMDASFAKVNSTLAGLGAIIGTAFAGAGVAGISQFVRSNVDALDALNDTKDATGSTIDKLSALEDVARRNGGTLDDVTGILVKFNQSLNSATDKNAAGQALTAIGLSAKDLRELDPADALQKVAVALQGYADDGNKARLSQELFGKSIREAAPFLNDLAEAGKLNGTITEEQAKAAERFNKQLFELQKNISDAARAFTSDLIPALSGFLREYTAGKEAFGGTGNALFSIGTSKPFSNEVQGLQEYRDKLSEVRIQLEKLAGKEASIGSLGPFDRNRLADLKASEGELAKFVTYYEKLLGLDSKAGGGRGSLFPGSDAKKSVGVLPGTIDRTKTAKPSKSDIFGPEIPDGLKDAISELEKTDVAKITSLREELQALINIKEGGGGGAKVDEAISKITLELEAMNPAMVEATANKAKLDALLAATPSAQLEKARDDMLFLADALEKGKISVEQFSEAAQSRLGIDVTQKLEQMSSFAQEAGKNIQDALGNTVLDTLKGNFDSIGDLWGNLILQMTAQAIAANLGQYLLGDFGKTGDIGGIVGTFLGLGRANGGAVNAGGIYPVVENGSPEVLNTSSGSYLLMGRNSGSVMPLKGGGAGGGNTTVIQVAGGVQRGEVLNLIAAAMRAKDAQDKARDGARGRF